MSHHTENRSKFFLLSAFKRITATEDNSNDYSVGLINNDIYRWSVVIIGIKETPYEQGIYNAEMIFPLNYPESPPKFRFISKMWHPNIGKDGEVCISILHEPGNDEYEYEDLSERWLPVRSPESVIISIISLLNSPNCESPANLEAALEYRDKPDVYMKKLLALAEETLSDYE